MNKINSSIQKRMKSFKMIGVDTNRMNDAEKKNKTIPSILKQWENKKSSFILFQTNCTYLKLFILIKKTKKESFFFETLQWVIKKKKKSIK